MRQALSVHSGPRSCATPATVVSSATCMGLLLLPQLRDAQVEASWKRTTARTAGAAPALAAGGHPARQMGLQGMSFRLRDQRHPPGTSSRRTHESSAGRKAGATTCLYYENWARPWKRPADRGGGPRWPACIGRAKLGMFDPAGVSYRHAHEHCAARSTSSWHTSLGPSFAPSKHHPPIKPDAKVITVIGPAAANLDVLLGNYHGMNAGMVTLVEGIIAQPEGVRSVPARLPVRQPNAISTIGPPTLR